MSIIYERLENDTTNELCYDEYNHIQFQLLNNEYVSVWDGEIWLMLKSDGVSNDGWMCSIDWIIIYNNGEVRLTS